MSEKTDQILKEARAALRKIIASKGRLQGNFYYVGNAKGTVSALAVTLTARDPKGSKASAAGKVLRKENKSAKFVRGIVVAEGSKLFFTPRAGTGTKDHMKLGFKKTLVSEEGFNFIKKAQFRVDGDESSSSSESTTGTETTESTDIDLSELLGGDMTAEEKSELESLIQDQEALGDLNEQLAAFLSDESDERELGEELAHRLDRISDLEQDPDRTEELQEERRLLAQSLYTGDDPFPGPGEEVSPEIRQVLALSMGRASHSLGLFLNDTAEKIKALHETISSADESWRAEHAPVLLQEIGDYRKAVHSYNEQLQKTLAPRRAVG